MHPIPYPTKHNVKTSQQICFLLYLLKESNAAMSIKFIAIDIVSPMFKT